MKRCSNINSIWYKRWMSGIQLKQPTSKNVLAFQDHLHIRIVQESDTLSEVLDTLHYSDVFYCSGWPHTAFQVGSLHFKKDIAALERVQRRDMTMISDRSGTVWDILTDNVMFFIYVGIIRLHGDVTFGFAKSRLCKGWNEKTMNDDFNSRRNSS